jgi:DNA repair protein RecN (Recombination protein N)
VLTNLYVQNLVLVRAADLGFGQGFSVVTGETGAGKSVLLEALGLLLGQRSDAGLVRHLADQASVAAQFQLAVDHPVQLLLQQADLPQDELLTLRRVVTPDGKSRAFVNDTPVSLASLKAIAAQVLELFGQFSQTRLTEPAEQRRLLDLYAGHGDLLRGVGAAYEAWRAAVVAEQEHQAAADIRARDRDYLQFAAMELAHLNPQVGEEDGLEEQRRLLQGLSKRQDGLRAALDLLQGSQGALNALYQAQRQLTKLLDEPALAAEAGLAEFDQAVDSLASLAEAWSSGWARAGDPSRLPEIEERLFALRDAARKHRVPVGDLPQLLQDWNAQLDALVQDAGQAEQLAKLTAAARERYGELASQLSASRSAAASRLAEQILAELPALKLAHARLEWRVEAPTGQTTIEQTSIEQAAAHGIDQIGVWVSMNPDLPLQPIARVASGGELTRTMLALAMVLQDRKDAPTLLVDELDSGVSGAVAAAIGERLRRLGATRQILAVSHTPQVAASADQHYLVVKQPAANPSQDPAVLPLLVSFETVIHRLSDTERREEIARLLSATEIHATARQLADQLLMGGG